MGLLAIHALQIKKEDLLPGDHIYTDRNHKTYFHHGIFIGDGQVIHFTKVSTTNPAVDSEKCTHYFDTTTDAHSGVRKCCLDCFLQQHHLYRFIYDEGLLAVVRATRSARHCTKATSVVRRATEELERESFGDYFLVWKNCETFAYFCTTGVKFHLSKQVLRALGFLVLVAVVIMVIGRGPFSGASRDVRMLDEEGEGSAARIFMFFLCIRFFL